MKQLSFIFLITLLLYSCSKKESAAPDPTEKNYYPVKTGYWVQYQVDSVKISFNDPRVDSTVVSYQMKEAIDSSEIDLAGNQRWLISVYRRTDSSSPWSFMKRWSLFMKDNVLHKIENDNDFIKLVFPITKGAQWYDQAYYGTDIENRLGSKMKYEYKEVNAPFQGRNANFDSTAQVLYYDYEDAINKDFFREIYAKNIGLVYKEEYQLEKSPSDDWDKPQRGYSIRYHYMNHAK